MKHLKLLLAALALPIALASGACDKKDDHLASSGKVQAADEAREQVVEASEKRADRAEDSAMAASDLAATNAKAAAARGEEVTAKMRFATNRDQVVTEAQALLGAMSAKAEQLRTRLSARSELDAAARAKAESAIADVTAARQRAADHLARLQQATADNWKTLRDEAASAFDAMDEAYERASDAIGGT
jgi:hypothetical protein